MSGVKISDLPQSLTPSLYQFIPVILAGKTERLSIQQLADLILSLIVDGSPEALDTLNELSAALGDDADFAGTVTAALAARLKLDGSTPMTGALNLGGYDLQRVANLVGVMGLFLGTTPPPGWLKLNGATLSRTTYADLWAYANASNNTVAEASWSSNWGKFSTGDGSTTFRLPDLRGEFLRMWDDGRGVDSGRAIGSYVADTLQGHAHMYYWANLVQVSGGAGVLVDQKGSPNPVSEASDRVREVVSDAPYGTARVSSETKPRSISVMPCIKY